MKFLKTLFISSFLFTAACSLADVEVKSFITSKGISVWLNENHQAPIIAMSFAFKNAGIIADPKNKEGTCDLLINSLNEGAGQWDGPDLRGLLEDMGSYIYFSVDADNIYGNVKCIKEHQKQTFEILRALFIEPHLKSEGIERTRGQLIASYLHACQTPGYLLRNKVNAVAYAGHEYSKFPTDKTYNNITLEDIKKFLKEKLAKSNLIIVISGDVTEKEAKIFIDQAFSELPEKTINPEIKSISLIPSKEIVVVNKDIPQSLISFYQNGVNPKDPNFFACMLVNHIFSGHPMESRLGKQIRVQGGLAYGVRSQLNNKLHADCLIGSTQTKNESASKVIQLIRDETNKLQNEGVTKEELGITKDQLTGEFALKFKTYESTASYLLGVRLLGFEPDYVNNRNKLIKEVSLEKANEFAKKFFKPFSFVIVGKPEINKNN